MRQVWAAARECECNGLFVSTESLEGFIKNLMLEASANIYGNPKQFSLTPDYSSYLRCPECNQIMNRTNFSARGGKKSGVLIDTCSEHGSWFDEGEFEKISEFVRSGGLIR